MPPRLPTLQPPPDIWGEPVTGAWAGPWPRLATSSLLHGITAFLPSIGASAVLADYFDEQAYQFNGVLASATALFAFALQPAIGVLSDVHGRKPLIAVCLASSALPNVALLCGSVWGWAVLCAVSGASGASTSLILAAISECTEEAHRAGAMGITLALTFGIGNLIGISVGASLFWQLGGPGLRRISTPDPHDTGSLLYQRLGALSFAAPLASAALNLCWLALCTPETAKRRATAAGCAALSPWRAFSLLALSESAGSGFEGRGALLAICALHYLLFASFFGYIMNKSLVLMHGFGLSAAQATPYVSFGAACSFLGYASIAPLRRCCSELAIAKFGFVSLILGFVLAAMATTPTLYYLVAALVAAGMMAAPALTSLASTFAPSGKQGATQALLGAFLSLAEGTGPLGVGLALSATTKLSRRPGAPFWVAAVACFAALVLLQVAVPRQSARAIDRRDSVRLAWTRLSPPVTSGEGVERAYGRLSCGAP